MENKALLDYSKLGEGAEAVKPSSMAVSEFHFLLLIGNKVKVRQSKQKIHLHFILLIYWLHIAGRSYSLGLAISKLQMRTCFEKYGLKLSR